MNIKIIFIIEKCLDIKVKNISKGFYYRKL